MGKHPRIQHQGHHLSVRATLWKTYIVCEECGEEYETAWNKLISRIDMLMFLPLLIFFWIFCPPVHDWSAASSLPAWLTDAAAICISLLLFIVFRILLNRLQFFLLRHSDDLASHIF